MSTGSGMELPHSQLTHALNRYDGTGRVATTSLSLITYCEFFYFEDIDAKPLKKCDFDHTSSNHKREISLTMIQD